MKFITIGYIAAIAVAVVAGLVTLSCCILSSQRNIDTDQE